MTQGSCHFIPCEAHSFTQCEAHFSAHLRSSRPTRRERVPTRVLPLCWRVPTKRPSPPNYSYSPPCGSPVRIVLQPSTTGYHERVGDPSILRSPCTPHRLDLTFPSVLCLDATIQQPPYRARHIAHASATVIPTTRHETQALLQHYASTRDTLQRGEGSRRDRPMYALSRGGKGV